VATKLKFDLRGKFPDWISVDPFVFGPATTGGVNKYPGIDDPSRFHMVGQSAIADGDDKPFFVVMARQGDTLCFDVDNADFNSRLTVLDPMGNVVAQNDDSGTTDNGSPTGQDPFIEFTAARSGLYIVYVSSFDNTYQGNFHFSDNGTAFGSFQLDMSIAGLPTRLDLGTAANVYSDSASTDHNIFGNDGNDRITLSGTSNDIVDGGSGNDTINLGGGNDVADGGAGNDQISGLAGSDAIDGGDGDDAIQGGTEDDELFGGTGNDTLVGDVGNDVLIGGDGDDILIPGLGDDYIDGGKGTNTISFIFSPNAVTIDLAGGTTGARHLGGGATIDGGSGGGTSTGEGTDTFANIQNIYGSPNNDTIIGDAKANGIYGQNGNDYIAGQGGKDLLNGEGDDDEINGGSGDDAISGGTGDDKANGEEGNDTVNGDAGDDYLVGFAGDDIINGGDDADVLVGGAGQDILTGGSGKDLFGYIKASDSPAGGAIDMIMDFEEGLDLIALNLRAPRHFIGTGAFTGQKGEVAYFVDGAGDTHILADYAGTGVADFEIVLKGTFAIQDSDFS